MTVGDREPCVRAPRRFRRPWLRSERAVPRRVARPLEQFLRQEAGSASLLMAAAVAALVWSNAATDSYDSFWSTNVTVDVGSLRLDEDLRGEGIGGTEAKEIEGFLAEGQQGGSTNRFESVSPRERAEVTAAAKDAYASAPPHPLAPHAARRGAA